MFLQETILKRRKMKKVQCKKVPGHCNSPEKCLFIKLSLVTRSKMGLYGHYFYKY